MKYQKTYGHNFSERGPDLSRCAESVYDNSSRGSFQCQRKATCDPDDAGKMTTCKQHSEQAVSDRRKTTEEKWAENSRRRSNAGFRMGGGQPLLDALTEIAEGHNNPRHHAQWALNNFNKAKK
jgi:hypothetical protein